MISEGGPNETGGGLVGIKGQDNLGLVKGCDG